MTTIAFRDGILAADSAITTAGVLDGYAEKIAANKKGDLFAGSGSFEEIEEIKDWFLRGEKGPAPEIFRDEAGETETKVMVFRASGRIDTMNSKPRWSPIFLPEALPFVSLGSGDHLALGALAMGATAVEAVQIASLFDGATNSRILVLPLGISNARPTIVDEDMSRFLRLSLEVRDIPDY